MTPLLSLETAHASSKKGRYQASGYIARTCAACAVHGIVL